MTVTRVWQFVATLFVFTILCLGQVLLAAEMPAVLEDGYPGSFAPSRNANVDERPRTELARKARELAEERERLTHANRPNPVRIDPRRPRSSGIAGSILVTAMALEANGQDSKPFLLVVLVVGPIAVVIYICIKRYANRNKVDK